MMRTALKLTAVAGLLMASIAQAATTIDVYRDPNCGCCKSWIKYLESNGFTVIEGRTALDATYCHVCVQEG